jgi:GMP synthase (glutamine-hydrolysing)
MGKRVILIRHGENPPDDRVFTHLASVGFEPDLYRPFAGEALPPADGTIAGSVIYGGPFEAYAYEKYPFLRDEAHWIETCTRQAIPLLGICQGAQQIAHVLGAPVGPPADETAEFGYYRIEPTEAGRSFLPEPIHVAQSHFHTFGIPSGAIHLARSALFPNQAFSYGATTLAVQFHAEVTIEGFRRWQENPNHRYDRKGAQTRERQDALMRLHDAVQGRWFHHLLDRLFGQPTE